MGRAESGWYSEEIQRLPRQVEPQRSKEEQTPSVLSRLLCEQKVEEDQTEGIFSGELARARFRLVVEWTISQDLDRRLEGTTGADPEMQRLQAEEVFIASKWTTARFDFC